MTIKLKPGKWVQRDGGIATVAAVDESRPAYHRALGWSSDGSAAGWSIDGSYSGLGEGLIDIIREYREPREGWAVIFSTREIAEQWAEHWHGPAVRVREVIE